jgi:hypothetical protein
VRGGQGERGCQKCKLIVQFIDHFGTNIIEKKGEKLDPNYVIPFSCCSVVSFNQPTGRSQSTARNLGDNVFTANPTINLHQQCTFAINACIGDDRKERVREDITTVEFAHIADGDAITEVVYASCSSSSTSNIMPKLNTTYFFSLDNTPYCWSPQSIEVEDSILSYRICCGTNVNPVDDCRVLPDYPLFISIIISMENCSMGYNRCRSCSKGGVVTE